MTPETIWQPAALNFEISDVKSSVPSWKRPPSTTL